MSIELPRLRDDLSISRHGAAACVVKDPISGKYFRLQATESFIAEQLDGKTPLEAIRQRAEQRFEATLSNEALQAFVASLSEAKLLESAPSKRAPVGRSRRLRGSLLYLRFKACDPDALFNRLVPHLRFCFTRAFVVCTAAVILSAAVAAAGNWDVLRQDMAELLRWQTLTLLLVAVCTVTTAHELAHGLTCKHFGGEVHEMGFMLLYFQPAMYCNVSDAWSFPQRSRRLWVGFAGPYFELFIWATAVLAWRLTEPETSLHDAACVVSATSGIKTLLNFNPLLKLDGYYLLSDWLDMPNLRQRSYAFVGSRLRRVLSFGAAETAEVGPRERLIFLSYGLISAALSFAVLGFAVGKIGGFLIDSDRPETFFLAGGLVAFKVRRRFRRLFGASSQPSDLEDEMPPGDPGATPPRAEGSDARGPMRNQRTAAGTRRVVLVVAAAIALSVLYFGRMPLRISAPFVVLPARNADVRAEVGGAVEQIFVHEGDQVSTGAIIARLSDRESRAALSQTEAEIAQTRAQLRFVQAGPLPEEIELARISVARAEDRARFAREDLERDRQLLQQRLISDREFEDRQATITEGENELAEARQRLKVLLAGRRTEEQDVLKAALARLEIQRRYLEEQVSRAEVASPADGIVTTPALDLRDTVGRVVKEGDTIAKVCDLKVVEVHTSVSEKDIADIHIGNRVALRARACPGQTFPGTVTNVGTTVRGPASGQSGTTTSTSLAAVATSRSGGTETSTVFVITRIANDSLLLKPGMTGNAKIYCGDRRLWDLVTRRLARTVRIEFWKWW